MTTLHEAVAEVATRLRSHGGTLSLVDATDGRVQVRFGGLCAGCPCKAVCLEHTVRPAVSAVPGVHSVHAAGARVSDEAQQRIQQLVDRDGAHR